MEVLAAAFCLAVFWFGMSMYFAGKDKEKYGDTKYDSPSWKADVDETDLPDKDIKLTE
jgi:hypothetical protein